MAEQWIDAATALRLVADVTRPSFLAHEALCQRAFAGLLRAKARLLVIADRQRSENVEVPAGFWWAKGQAALKQNWVSGDFSTSTKEPAAAHWAVFGVTFALADVLEMLPVEHRAAAARQVSVVGDPAWVTARDARLFAFSKARLSAKAAPRAILDQARLGFVTGRAVLAQHFRAGRTAEPHWEEREWDVPDWFWASCPPLNEDLDDWELGTFVAEVPPSLGPGRTKLSGVHFLRESLQVLLPAQDRVADSESEAKGQGKGGGRPAQAWWDDMWCAVSGLLLHGQLVPDRQADVEKAMLTWAAINGHEISQTAVKPKAKKLFEAYDKEGTNFLKG